MSRRQKQLLPQLVQEPRLSLGEVTRLRAISYTPSTSPTLQKEKVAHLAHLGHLGHPLTKEDYSAVASFLTRTGIVNVNVEPRPT